MNGTAIISDCGRFRYRLSRELIEGGDRRTALFVMFNPSTADAEVNDPTIRRCMEFSMSWGYTKLVVVNLFALRTVEPRVLRAASLANIDVVGPKNDDHIRMAVQEANIVICAWGSNADRYEQRVKHVVRILRQYRPLQMIHRTKSGGPAHPLYLHSRLKPIMYMEQYS